MDSPYFVIAGDVNIPSEVTKIHLITGLSRYDFATIAIDEDDDAILLLRRVDPEELATFEGVLFQADSGDEENTVVLRQVSLAYWPYEDDEVEDEDDDGEEEQEAAALDEDDDDDDDEEPRDRGFTVVTPQWWDDFTRKHRRG